MLLGALVDVGFPAGRLNDIARALCVDARIEVKNVARAGLRASQVVVEDARPTESRSAQELIDLVAKTSALSPGVRDRARAALERLAATESRIHGVPIADAHLHELSGSDTLIDVVGALAALEEMGISEVRASAVNLGGASPTAGHRPSVPAPATATLLRRAPVYGMEDAGELTTPTGALLLASIVTSWGALPAMRVDAVGYGAGSRDPVFPNVLRCFLGTRVDSAADRWRPEIVTVLETNIDDLQPQFYERLSDRLFAAGALDVVVIPMVAKHGRPGAIVQAIGTPDREHRLLATLFEESTTLGVRRRSVERFVLERRSETRATSLGRIEVKVALLPDGSERVSPEYRELVRIAEANGLPVIEVMRRIARDL